MSPVAILSIDAADHNAIVPALGLDHEAAARAVTDMVVVAFGVLTECKIALAHLGLLDRRAHIPQVVGIALGLYDALILKEARDQTGAIVAFDVSDAVLDHLLPVSDNTFCVLIRGLHVADGLLGDRPVAIAAPQVELPDLLIDERGTLFNESLDLIIGFGINRLVRFQGRPNILIDDAILLHAHALLERLDSFVSGRAEDVHPEKIGCLGFSAGGHLTLMTAAASQTPAYLAIDELDKIPCHVNFAVPVYPAYVLAECADRPYSGTGENLKLVPELQFDSQTPPMCLIHGDADSCPAYASIAVYHKLRTMNIPAEIHIYAKVGHGFGAARGGDHFKAWLDRVHDWMKLMRF